MRSDAFSSCRDARAQVRRDFLNQISVRSCHRKGKHHGFLWYARMRHLILDLMPEDVLSEANATESSRPRRCHAVTYSSTMIEKRSRRCRQLQVQRRISTATGRCQSTNSRSRVKGSTATDMVLKCHCCVVDPLQNAAAHGES